MIYIPELEGCADITPDYSAHVKGKFAGGSYVNPGRITSGIVMVDPATSEVKKRIDLPYPNFAGVLSTAGGLVVTALLDGTVVAFSDQTLAELWRFNAGTGFNAPPMTYAVDGKQYIAIASGLFRNAKSKLSRAPEMKNLSNATMIYVFGL
jgi:alcohol dehydrogenase (cytochrome c)